MCGYPIASSQRYRADVHLSVSFSLDVVSYAVYSKEIY